jgi:hypothetical protein
MPLVQYFAVVGSILLALCWGAGWYFPEPDTKVVHSDIDKPAIRIPSVEKLPERVVIDTSLPTIVPSEAVIAIADEAPETAPLRINPGSRLTSFDSANAIPKKQNTAKQQSLKKVATRRAAPSGSAPAGSSTGVQAAAPVSRMSLIDIVKERLARSLFN